MPCRRRLVAVTSATTCMMSRQVLETRSSNQAMKQVYVKTRDEWRDWLKQHHDTCSGIWLVCYKKHTGKPSLEYDATVEEALCFGWIDSIIKTVDEERYLRKLTPRKPTSRWSDSNKKRVRKLEKQGLMAQPGIARVKSAREAGLWDKPDRLPLAGSRRRSGRRRRNDESESR